MLSSEGTVTTYVSRDKSRTESEMKSKSKLMGSFGGNLDTTSIMRLDKELIWQLVPDKKQYTVMTFEQLRAQIKESMAQLEEMKQSGDSNALPIDEEECEWSDSKMDVRDTNERRRFANVKAEQHIITVEETCKIPDSDQVCVMTLENWMAKRMPGDDEVREFQQALAEKLGTEELMSGMQGASTAMFSMFRDGWDTALDEAADLKGCPVKTVMQMEMGGENCTAASGQPIAMDEMWANAMEAAMNAGAQTAGQHAGQAIAEETAEAMGDSVGGSIAGSAVGAASSEILGGLFKGFGKKKKKPEPEPVATAEPQAATASGSVVLFRISTELIAVDDDRIPEEHFELPAGWKKRSPGNWLHFAGDRL
jgi:hypothetical protein